MPKRHYLTGIVAVIPLVGLSSGASGDRPGDHRDGDQGEEGVSHVPMAPRQPCHSPA